MIDFALFTVTIWGIAWASPPRVPGRRASRAPPPSVVLNGKLHCLTPPTGVEATRNSTVTDCKQALTAKSGPSGGA